MTPRRSLVVAAALAACSSPAQPVAPAVATAAPRPAPVQPPAPQVPSLPAELSPCPRDVPAPATTAAPIQIIDSQHTGQLLAFDFDAHGRLATANDDGSVRIWHLPTGALVNVLHQPLLGRFVQRMYWIGDYLALLGEYLNTMTVDVIGNIVAQNQPPRSSFADDSHPSNQDHALHLDMHGTRVVVKVPDDVSPFAVGHVVTAHGITAGTAGKTILIDVDLLNSTVPPAASVWPVGSSASTLMLSRSVTRAGGSSRVRQIVCTMREVSETRAPTVRNQWSSARVDMDCRIEQQNAASRVDERVGDAS
jgi:hypothetical protein